MKSFPRVTEEHHLRTEIIRGCELAKRLEEQLAAAAAAAGPLHSSREASDRGFRLSLFSSSCEISAIFHTAALLLRPRAAGAEDRLDACLGKAIPPPQKRQARERSAFNAEGVVSPTRSRAASILSARSAPSFTPSPPFSSVEIDMSPNISESSPPKSSVLELDSGDSPPCPDASRMQNKAVGAPNEHANAAVNANSKKRKMMPKTTLEVYSDVESEVPPHDGHTWRKYGQKKILGRSHPRCYYRCTHKHDRGCPVKKSFQKSDKNPRIFEVIYQGIHSCLPTQLNGAAWFPHAIPPLTPQQSQGSQSILRAKDSDGTRFSSSLQLQPRSFHFPLQLSSSSSAPNINASSVQPSITRSLSAEQPTTARLGAAATEGVRIGHVSALERRVNTVQRLGGLLPSGDCIPAGAAISPQSSSPAMSYGSPFQGDSIYSETLAAQRESDRQIYDMVMNPCADFLLPAGANPEEGAGRAGHGAFLEQSFASEHAGTGPGGLMDILNSSLLSDDFFDVEEESLLSVADIFSSPPFS